MNVKMEKKRKIVLRHLGLGLCLVGFGVVNTSGSVTNDRLYLLGDDSFEGANSGVVVGGGSGTDQSYDSAGDLGVGQLQDLTLGGAPKYVGVSDRPGASGGDLGVIFDGANDYLWSANLNLPASTQSSTGSNDSETGTLNYTGLANRGFQFWVKPSDGITSEQHLVMDANQHGAAISEDNTWVMRYAGTDYDSGVTVSRDEWHHVMVVRANGAANGSRMYVDGVVVGAAGGGYTGSSTVPLAIGANTDGFDSSDFTGGTESFFKGIIDDVEMFVIGDNTAEGGMDYGTFDYMSDNGAISALGLFNGISGDLNQDGSVDQADTDAFIAGWLSEQIVNGIVAGDVVSHSFGDMNFDGVTDVHDINLYVDAYLSANPGGAAPIISIPEPGSLMLAGIAGLALLGRGGREG